MDSNYKQKDYIFLILTFVIWGSLYVVSKYVLGKVPPGIVAFSRFFVAFIVLTLMQGKNRERVEKEDFKYVLLIGVVGYFISVGAQLLGTRYAGASIASLINALNPVTITVFAAIILKEKLTVRKVLGVFLALVGVYVILGKGSGGASLLGIVLSLISVLVWSLVSVLTKKMTGKYKSITITRNAVGIAVLCYLPVGIFELASGAKIMIDVPAIISLLYMGSVCTGISFMLWNKSLSVFEAGTCSALYPLQPMVSTLLGIVFLHEKISLAFVLGSVLIIAGVLVNLSSKKVPQTA